MEVILVSKNKSSASKITLHSGMLSFCLLLAGVFAIGMFYAGIQFSEKYSMGFIQDQYLQLQQDYLAEINKQKEMLEHAKQDARVNLDALATRLSKLQGHIMRLDALGARLARMADLEDVYFDGNTSMGMGGPESSISSNSLPVSDFMKQLELLENDIDNSNDKLSAMEMLLMNNDIQSKTQPDGSPLQNGWISSLFGWRADPITGRKEFHEGIDFAGKSGSLVSAVAAGIVTWAGKRNGYGHMIEIDHGNGYVTRYAHNRQNLVNIGDKVDKGQVIAIIGSSGRSTGTHIHFEVVHNGKNVNPKKFISVN